MSRKEKIGHHDTFNVMNNVTTVLNAIFSIDYCIFQYIGVPAGSTYKATVTPSDCGGNLVPAASVSVVSQRKYRRNSTE